MSEDLLFEYALGTLEDPSVVEAALAADPALREALAEIQEILGCVPDELAPIAPDASVLERLLTEADPRPRLERFVSRFAEFIDTTAEAARDLLSKVDGESIWEASPWAGVKLLHLPCGPRVAAAEVGFVRMEPGLRFPWHEHKGEEHVLVLQGAYADGVSGKVHVAGDEDHRDAGTPHDYTVLPGPDLIYVVVLYEGLDFPEPPPGH